MDKIQVVHSGISAIYTKKRNQMTAKDGQKSFHNIEDPLSQVSV